MLVETVQLLGYDDLQHLATYCGLETCRALTLVSRELRSLFLPFTLHTIAYDGRTCTSPQTLVEICRKHGQLVRRFEGCFGRAVVPRRPLVAPLRPRDILPYLPHLEELSLYWPQGVTLPVLRGWVMPRANGLLRLELKQDPSSPNAGLFTGLPVDDLTMMPRLQALVLDGFGSGSGASYHSLFWTQPRLRTLALTKYVTDSMVQAIAYCLPDLIELTLRLTQVSMETLSLLARQCSRLERLQISGLTTDNLAFLGDVRPSMWPRLTHLVLERSELELSIDPFADTTPFDRFLSYPWLTIRSLTCRYVPINDRTLELISRNCPQLQRIVLSMCHPQASTGGYRFLLESLPQLREFAVESNGDHALDSDILPTQKLGSSRIRRLSLKIHRVNLRHFLPLLPQLHHLQNLTVSRSCKKLDFSLLQHHAPNLHIAFR
ncbi:hypothetical protein IWQ62_002214 [Dispira parvispora]|uniref:F-box domain-containing protein n=1 Tax=Dispira parvispora TaxID=1520584 RepID=A0A9W8E2Y0_9FUNG|nr:hypothetical protein IWQ62_002214 [Dispira parvispora]